MKIETLGKANELVERIETAKKNLHQLTKADHVTFSEGRISSNSVSLKIVEETLLVVFHKAVIAQFEQEIAQMESELESL